MCFKRPCILVTIQIIPLRDLPEAHFECALVVAIRQSVRQHKAK